MINNPVDRKKIRDALQEVSNSYTRIEAERDLIKNVVGDLSDQFGLDKRTLRKMARTYHKQNFADERQAFDEFEELYESLLMTTG